MVLNFVAGQSKKEIGEEFGILDRVLLDSVLSTH